MYPKKKKKKQLSQQSQRLHEVNSEHVVGENQG